MTTYGEVVEVEQLTPRMVRVVLGGDGLADFTPTEWTDQYVNALFVPPGAPYAVPFDPDEARQLASRAPTARPPLHDPVVGPRDPPRGDRLRRARRRRHRRPLGRRRGAR